MASCELSIELTEPDRVYDAGDHVDGVVVVRVDKDVKCNGLRIETGWETHGKGNVARGTGDKGIVFQGDWMAGEAQRYNFSLKCASWPPTYHGKQLNIDHYVYAQADIPWAIDPKAKQPFRVLPTVYTKDQEKKSKPEPIELKGAAAWFGGGCVLVFVVIVIAIFVFNPFFALVVFLMLSGAAGWWFFTKFLPKWKLGKVSHVLQSEEISPGQTLRAELVIEPKGHLAINGISWRVRAEEVCVRGSGTNKRTYREQVFEQSQTVAESTSLSANEQHRFQLEAVIPHKAPLSVDLANNDLVWIAEAQVDIPKWPDWIDKQKFSLVPAKLCAGDRESSTDQPPSAEAQASVSFADTVDLVSKVRHDFDQLDRLIDGVAGLELDIQARLQRRISIGQIDPSIGDPAGFVVEANYPEPHLPLLLYAPREMSDQLDGLDGQLWSGRGTIVGYDRRTGSLQIRLT